MGMLTIWVIRVINLLIKVSLTLQVDPQLLEAPQTQALEDRSCMNGISSKAGCIAAPFLVSLGFGCKIWGFKF